MVYCTRDTIARQWYKTFSKCMPSYEQYIWIVGECPPPEDGSIPAFIICMDERVDKIPDHILKSIGMLIIDEAHMFCTPSRVKCLLKCQPLYVILESATLERDDGMHAMVQSMAGFHGVFMISKDPYLFYSIETNAQVQLVKNKFGNDFGKLCESLSMSEQRNNKIVSIVAQNPHRKFIILSKLADHVELLEKFFQINGIKAGTLYRSKSTYSDSPVLIGTMPKMGTGFDEANACEDFQGKTSDVLILAHSVKKWQQYEQFRGRVMRCKAPIVIWLNDPNSTTRKHLEELRPWILKTNGTIIPIHHNGIIQLPSMDDDCLSKS